MYKKRNKLLHLGKPQLQVVVNLIPSALIPYDEEVKNDAFTTLATKFYLLLSALWNSAFEACFGR